LTGRSRTFDDLPEWEFQTKEVSAGVYKVRGVDKCGRSVECTSEDPSEALDYCRKAACEIESKKVK